MQVHSFAVEGLLYALDEPPSRQGKKSVITVRLEDAPDAAGSLVDRVDLYSFRSRKQFAGLVADVFGRQTREVLGHLALVLDESERARAEKERPASIGLSPERRAAAQALLEQPGLLESAAKAMEALGYVGEEQAKRLCYLVATSRLLGRPLSAILMAPSGSGKSELLDVVGALLPSESVEFLSRLTSNALYYAGEDHLRHKLVLVDEHTGASEADYSLRTLQSKGLLSLRVPQKGETFMVYGPISLMSGTTSSDLNPENLSRCLEIPLDDSPQQTRRIQEAQRQAWEGSARGQVDLGLWQDAQRLLEPLPVVIPFATQLSFPARTTSDRRGNQKLLGLVAAHALLCQLQRRRDSKGHVVATPLNYQVVYELLRPVVDADLVDLSPRASRLYRHMSARENRPTTRRELAGEIGWSYNTAKRALVELSAQELVAVCDPGPPLRYRLLDTSLLGSAGALVPPSELAAAPIYNVTPRQDPCQQASLSRKDLGEGCQRGAKPKRPASRARSGA